MSKFSQLFVSLGWDTKIVKTHRDLHIIQAGSNVIVRDDRGHSPFQMGVGFATEVEATAAIDSLIEFICEACNSKRLWDQPDGRPKCEPCSKAVRAHCVMRPSHAVTVTATSAGSINRSQYTHDLFALSVALKAISPQASLLMLADGRCYLDFESQGLQFMTIPSVAAVLDDAMTKYLSEGGT